MWGKWRLFKSGYLELTTNKSRCVGLNRCHNSAEILDWIFHYRGRLEAAELVDMLAALEAILDPRANYCSQGSNQSHNPMELVREYWDKTAKPSDVA